MRRHHIAFSMALGLSFSAHAGSGHSHGDAHAVKALHGGVVSEAKHLTFELVPQTDNVTAKSSLDLRPSGVGQLSAPLQQPIAAGSKVVALVKLPGKSPTQVRFAIK
jgi:hypothetical protein